MKIYIIRHGDPDYVADSLTPRGILEAKALGEVIPSLHIDKIYSSPHGRAKLTAELAMGENRKDEIVVLPWLREFHCKVDDKILPPSDIPWDKYPDKWTEHSELYSYDNWAGSSVWEGSEVKTRYAEAREGLFEVLKENGYVARGKGVYDVIESNRLSIAFFCHFGQESILLSHLFGVSPQPILQYTCALPTAVTTVVTEERQKGIATFRCLSFGDVSHITRAGLEPSFSARFCETYDNFEERH